MDSKEKESKENPFKRFVGDDRPTAEGSAKAESEDVRKVRGTSAEDPFGENGGKPENE